MTQRWFSALGSRPGMSVAELKNLTAPLFDKWTALGISTDPEYYQYDAFLPAWTDGFALETVGSNTTKQGSRLVPRETFTNETRFNSFYSALREVLRYRRAVRRRRDHRTRPRALISQTTLSTHPGATPRSISSRFRFWDANTAWGEYMSYSKVFTNDWMPILKNATPGSGGYDSEGDVNEPDFKQSYYGLETYDRLLEIKDKYDPESLSYANKGVGSDAWYVTGQSPGLPTQNGKLCRVSS